MFSKYMYEPFFFGHILVMFLQCLDHWEVNGIALIFSLYITMYQIGTFGLDSQHSYRLPSTYLYSPVADELLEG